MKLSAARDVLLKPLQAVIGVVERRQTMPILSNVLLVAKNGELAVTATDLEVELVAQAEVAVAAGGEITVSGRKLLDICRALPEGTEILSPSNGAITGGESGIFLRLETSKNESNNPKANIPNNATSAGEYLFLSIFNSIYLY